LSYTRRQKTLYFFSGFISIIKSTFMPILISKYHFWARILYYMPEMKFYTSKTI